ncbi:MAG: hypothetical protein RI932_1146 [Pseudomonadota bacterium]
MQKIFRKILLATGLASALLVALGAIIWLATARHSEFYLFKSMRGQASASLWLTPPQSSENRWGLISDNIGVSVWISPDRVSQAVRHFDVWMQEYSLLRELTDEAAQQEGDGYVLPPSALPEAEMQEDQVFLEDSYDLALRELLQDVWHSGFFVVGGTVHFRSPFWLKPGIGWLSSGVHPKVATSFFDAYLSSLGDREDGADVPSWFTEIPFAHLELLQSDGVNLQESVFELGGEQLASLHARLCDLGHLPESWCYLEEDSHNPLEALLYATEDFRAQFRVYWQMRGDHLVWSNSPGCLSTLLSHRDIETQSCGEFTAVGETAELSGEEKRFFEKQSASKTSMAAGFFVDQQLLHSAFEIGLKRFEDTQVDGASWLNDALQSAGGLRQVQEIRVGLLEESMLRPRWGARFVWEPPEAGELSTFARFTQNPGSDERLAPRWAESQFKFLYGLISAWRGLPRSPGQIQKIEPWQKKKSFWNAVARYRLGWSESQ